MWRSTPAKVVTVEYNHDWHSTDPLDEELGIIRSFYTIESTALLRFLPEDGSPYKFPSTCSTIPCGAMIPSGVAKHSMKSLLQGVT